MPNSWTAAAPPAKDVDWLRGEVQKNKRVRTGWKDAEEGGRLQIASAERTRGNGVLPW